MQKTIVQGRHDRLKERVFWEWRVAYARAIKQGEAASTKQMPRLIGEHVNKSKPAGTDMNVLDEAEDIFEAYLHQAASEDKAGTGEHIKQATS